MTPAQLARRPYGPTGLQVTPVCVGCAPLGDMRETFAYSVSEEQALATLRAVFAGPINFVDTAASYGDGESERRIGLALREFGGVPAGVVLATKADRDLLTGDFSGPQMRRSVERSLHLLGLDRLPVVYLHDPEHTTFAAATAPGGAVETLVRLKEEGLIGHLGVAGGPIDMSIQYVELGVFDVVITHNRYTLLNRTAVPLLDVAHARGLGVANAAPYGSGMLAKGPDAYPRYAYHTASPELIEKTRRLAALCKQYGVPLAAVALQFSTRDPRITSTIIGMTKPERIQQTIDLLNTPVPDDIWPQVDAIAAPFPANDPEAERWK
jgi:D-threo-aldose 1-dehydrogenase